METSAPCSRSACRSASSLLRAAQRMLNMSVAWPTRSPRNRRPMTSRIPESGDPLAGPGTNRPRHARCARVRPIRHLAGARVFSVVAARRTPCAQSFSAGCSAGRNRTKKVITPSFRFYRKPVYTHFDVYETMRVLASVHKYLRISDLCKELALLLKPRTGEFD